MRWCMQLRTPAGQQQGYRYARAPKQDFTASAITMGTAWQGEVPGRAEVFGHVLHKEDPEKRKPLSNTCNHLMKNAGVWDAAALHDASLAASACKCSLPQFCFRWTQLGIIIFRQQKLGAKAGHGVGQPPLVLPANDCIASW